jgi:hypothetical protein
MGQRLEKVTALQLLAYLIAITAPRYDLAVTLSNSHRHSVETLCMGRCISLVVQGRGMNSIVRFLVWSEFLYEISHLYS